MRILHTSDWHLGKRLSDIERIDEQVEVLAEICTIADEQQVDVVVVAGDLFDTSHPPVRAIDLFYKMLKRLASNGKRPVIAIAGNHDSPQMIEAPDPLARECGIIFAGYPGSLVHEFGLDSGIRLSKSDRGFIELQLPSYTYPLRLILTPYANEVRLRTELSDDSTGETLRAVLEESWRRKAGQYMDGTGVNMLVAHLLFTADEASTPEEPEEERSIAFIGGAQAIFTENLPAQVQYVALGHLHRKQTVSSSPCPVVYSGSPLAYSFGEADQDKYVMIVDLEPGLPAVVTPVKLESSKRLLRKTFDSIDTAVEWLSENQENYVELTIKSDTYLTAIDQKRLYSAHSRIIGIIPMVKLVKGDAQADERIDLQENMMDLFKKYFVMKKGGQVPGENIVSLFAEVIASEEDEEITNLDQE